MPGASAPCIITQAPLDLPGLDKPEIRLSNSPLLEPHHGGLVQREAELLSSGTLDGISRGIKLSLLDLHEFGSNMRSSPISTSASFIKEHWSEGAVAAGIALLAPRKYMNCLILATSSRGVALSTLEGISAAADSSQDFNAVKDRFSSRLSMETRALVNSLPMTLAGGVAGRSLGNVVFGKNMGALDLASGRLSMAEVKANLFKAYDKINPPQAKLAVFDLDGTLVSSSKHLSLGIEEGLKHLSASTGLAPELVLKLMGEQFGKLKSFTNPWTVELALAEKLNVGKPNGMSYEQFKTTVSDPYYKIFQDSMSRNLNVYDGVQSTLSALEKKGVGLMLLTNSPACAAIPRLRSSGIDAQIKEATGLTNAKPPQGLAPELLQHGAERLKALSLDNTAFTSIERQLAKPNPQVLLEKIKAENLRPSQVMVIGDSLESDMMLAHKSASRGLWAKWSEIDASYDALLNRVSAGNFPPAKTSGFPFEKALNSVPEILNSLRPPRDIAGLLKSSAGLPAWYLPLESYGIANWQPSDRVK